MENENNLPFDEQKPETKVGRPTKYDPAKNEMVTNLCLLGATDDEIADWLGIDRSTLYDWKKTHDEFFNAIQSGKIEADALVAKSLYRSAMTGDTGASKHWLNNRRRQSWSEKTETKVTIAAEQVFKIGDVEVKF